LFGSQPNKKDETNIQEGRDEGIRLTLMGVIIPIQNSDREIDPHFLSHPSPERGIFAASALADKTPQTIQRFRQFLR